MDQMTMTSEQAHRAFDDASKSEANYRKMEYAVADHAEKAAMHAYRWRYLNAMQRAAERHVGASCAVCQAA